MAEEEEEEESWSLPQEVEVLESIYPEELHVCRGISRSEPWEISITLYPATAEDQESQYVRVTLQLSVPPEYPKKPPKICLRNPRGLSDEHLLSISKNLRHLADSGLGGPVLYELLVKAKEILTENNIPYGECVICQYGFQANEAFTKTSCYHYFHSHCLARYARHMEVEVQSKLEEKEQNRINEPQEDLGVHCPVCRELLTYDLEILQAAPPPNHPLEVYNPDKQTIQHQRKLRKIYEKQQAKGGIIDPEAERNRYFISLQTPPVDENTTGDVDAAELIDVSNVSEKIADPETGLASSTNCSLSSEDSNPHPDPGHTTAPKDSPPTSSSARPCGNDCDEPDKDFSTNRLHSNRGWPRGRRPGFRGQSHRSRPPFRVMHEVGIDHHSYFRRPPRSRERRNSERGRGGSGRGRAHNFQERTERTDWRETQADNGTDCPDTVEKGIEQPGVTEKENSVQPPSDYRDRWAGRGQYHPRTQGDGRWVRPRYREPRTRHWTQQQPKPNQQPPTTVDEKDVS